MQKPRIVLYIDIVSPFAYLAFHVLRTSPIFKDVEVTFIPVFLGGIMKATGNSPPITVKNKAEWVGKERLRWAKLFNVPMAELIPPGFPQNTLQVQRALTAASEVCPEKVGDAAAALYHLEFVERGEVQKPDSVRPVLVNVFGEAAARVIVEKATSDDIKKRLTANTEQALATGSFGLPWYVVTNSQGKTECFWGFDHIGQVTNHLGLERLKPGAESESGWRAML